MNLGIAPCCTCGCAMSSHVSTSGRCRQCNTCKKFTVDQPRLKADMAAYVAAGKAEKAKRP